ncbi:hypothetical protein CAPN002_00310 [Capnocytophaga stomatis]|uniref:DUF3853 family protein n=1 Tax=Capnocytophaga stomatis TaxID=1848904 RepID=UPI00194F4024|nr:DUF3853 family protein [Capnocytophaga stomatis]GIJ92813.1 hypothetical protein CAPN002_00310 [Capnocytophaga stomatis]
MQDVYNVPMPSISVGEFLDLLAERIKDFSIEKQSNQFGEIKKTEKKYAYGLNGLAEVLGCSRSTASKIKQSGKIDRAIFQQGRKIIIDVDLALQLFNTM